jgi:cyanate permease
MGGSAIGYLLLATGAPALLVIGAGVAFFTGWGWNALFIHSVVTLNPDAPAASTGVTQTGGFAGSVVGPAAFGYAVGAFGFSWAWLGLVVCSAAAASFVTAARRRVRTEETLAA